MSNFEIILRLEKKKETIRAYIIIVNVNAIGSNLAQSRAKVGLFVVKDMVEIKLFLAVLDFFVTSDKSDHSQALKKYSKF